MTAAVGGPGRLARWLIALVTGYRRWLSPLVPARCRFTPSCSAYAIEALAHHGARRGGTLVVWRVARCQPFCAGGHDPVPAVRPVHDPHHPDSGLAPTDCRLGATP